MPHPPRTLRTALLVSLLVAPAARAAGEAVPLETFDAEWARRAEGAAGGRAKEAVAARLVALGRSAVAAQPASLAFRWRLMRALYFQGEHATEGAEAKKAVFEQGKKLGEETLDLIRREAGAAAGKDLSKATPVELVPWVKGVDVAECFLWSGVNWGKWALVFGKTAAARQGAAAKIRDDAAAVIRLDPALEEGGGYRVLGRLHHQTPSIPFITGWASRDEALKNLRLAVEKGPRNFVNRLYLAEATWDYEKGRRAEARKMLEALVAEAPTAEYAVEDARAQEDARALLAGWAGK
jgi:hypothetical protein